jgi:hypothetical protein
VIVVHPTRDLAPMVSASMNLQQIAGLNIMMDIELL